LVGDVYSPDNIGHRALADLAADADFYAVAARPGFPRALRIGKDTEACRLALQSPGGVAQVAATHRLVLGARANGQAAGQWRTAGDGTASHCFRCDKILFAIADSRDANGGMDSECLQVYALLFVIVDPKSNQKNGEIQRLLDPCVAR